MPTTARMMRTMTMMRKRTRTMKMLISIQ